jgi:RNA polymerase sigma-70 factor, ECF subfamily
VDAPSDAELIERILNGERELFTLLVGRYQEMLHRFAFGMIQDPDAVADLVQESFVKAYTSLAQCNAPHHFSAWIFRIVRNGCTDYLRAPQRRHVDLEATSLSLASHSDPAQELEHEELRHTVRSALASLPEAQREAFLLKHVENLSYEEMAEMLGAGVSALKMRVARAREALRSSLRAADLPGGPSM